MIDTIPALHAWIIFTILMLILAIMLFIENVKKHNEWYKNMTETASNKYCPECVQGKPRNCTGWVINDDDQIVECKSIIDAENERDMIENG